MVFVIRLASCLIVVSVCLHSDALSQHLPSYWGFSDIGHGVSLHREQQQGEKRKKAKGKGEKEIYTHLNAEFQRIERRDKKAFLSDHCKEIEENNRMGKTRDLFKKIRDTKGTFHAKMGSIKDRSGMDLTEAEDIKKRWQEYTEELYKKDIHDPDNHDGVITHLEPDILEHEVK